ncbi:MAG TPA: PTS ascorbate transporter subunit IIC, partial [Firmicutes bacterium]|nr:PTS ascorbate transporter subunit IIC [Bacillota bacterium]
TLVGLIAARKPAAEIISGTVKSILGFVILGGGAGILVGALNNMGPLMEAGFGVKGVVPNNEAIVAIAQKTLGAQTALIMVFGFLANLLFARITPFKYIFLTGHHTFYMAAMLSAVLGTAGLQGSLLVVVGSVLLGGLMVLMPALANPYMVQVTGGSEIALGHFGTFGYWLSGTIGRLFGKKEDSLENYQFPKGLSFFRDSLVSTSTVMFLIFLVSAIAAGNAFTLKLSGGQNLLVFSLLQALTFAGGVAVVLYGVRMILGEIVPAFKGISDKLVPNAKPALDCPIVFPYAPTAMLVGFLVSFLGGIVSMIIMGAVGLPVIVPGLIPHFFVGGTAGVFGNAAGGKRGAILGSFANGVLISFGAAFLLPTLGALGFQNTTYGDSDFQIIGIIVGGVGNALKGSPTAIAGVLLAILAVILLAGSVASKRSRMGAAKAA